MSPAMKKVSRRRFLTGAARLGAAGLAAAPWLTAAELPSAAAAPLKRPFGRTGVELPVVNMGVMNAHLPELVRRAFEKGVRFFDTAAYYQRGRNETMVGRTLKDMGVRDQALIGTKIYVPEPQRPRLTDAEWKKAFVEGAESSLARLDTDRIDVLSFHSASDPEELALPGVREAMEELKRQGKIRWAGFSTHRNMASVVAGAGRFYDVGVVAFNYAMADDAAYLKVLADAAGSGLALVAMKTQCTQYWYRDLVPEDKQSLYRGRILHTAVLKWAVSHGFIATAIPGFNTLDQLEEDLSVNEGLELTPEETRFLEDRGVRGRMQEVCVQCSSCVGTCPRGVETPSLVRAHMYLTAYGNLDAARTALAEAPEGRGLERCRDCAECVASCSRRVPLSARLTELREFCVDVG